MAICLMVEVVNEDCDGDGQGTFRAHYRCLFGLLNGREDGHSDDLWQIVETVMMMVYVNCRNSHGDGLW